MEKVHPDKTTDSNVASEYVGSGSLCKHLGIHNNKILQLETGIIYNDAIDIFPCQYTYEETNIPIEDEETEE